METRCWKWTPRARSQAVTLACRSAFLYAHFGSKPPPNFVNLTKCPQRNPYPSCTNSTSVRTGITSKIPCLHFSLLSLHVLPAAGWGADNNKTRRFDGVVTPRDYDTTVDSSHSDFLHVSSSNCSLNGARWILFSIKIRTKSVSHTISVTGNCTYAFCSFYASFNNCDVTTTGARTWTLEQRDSRIWSCLNTFSYSRCLLVCQKCCTAIDYVTCFYRKFVFTRKKKSASPTQGVFM